MQLWHFCPTSPRRFAPSTARPSRRSVDPWTTQSRAVGCYSKAKFHIQHGGWQKFIIEDCDLSYRSAARYCQLAKSFDALAADQQQAAAEMSMRQATISLFGSANPNDPAVYVAANRQAAQGMPPTRWEENPSIRPSWTDDVPALSKERADSPHTEADVLGGSREPVVIETHGEVIEPEQIPTPPSSRCPECDAVSKGAHLDICQRHALRLSERDRHTTDRHHLDQAREHEQIDATPFEMPEHDAEPHAWIAAIAQEFERTAESLMRRRAIERMTPEQRAQVRRLAAFVLGGLDPGTVGPKFIPAEQHARVEMLIGWTADLCGDIKRALASSVNSYEVLLAIHFRMQEQQTELRDLLRVLRGDVVGAPEEVA